MKSSWEYFETQYLNKDIDDILEDQFQCDDCLEFYPEIETMQISKQFNIGRICDDCHAAETKGVKDD